MRERSERITTNQSELNDRCASRMTELSVVEVHMSERIIGTATPVRPEPSVSEVRA